MTYPTSDRTRFTDLRTNAFLEELATKLVQHFPVLTSRVYPMGDMCKSCGELVRVHTLDSSDLYVGDDPAVTTLRVRGLTTEPSRASDHGFMYKVHDSGVFTQGVHLDPDTRKVRTDNGSELVHEDIWSFGSRMMDMHTSTHPDCVVQVRDPFNLQRRIDAVRNTSNVLHLLPSIHQTDLDVALTDADGCLRFVVEHTARPGHPSTPELLTHKLAAALGRDILYVLVQDLDNERRVYLRVCTPEKVGTAEVVGGIPALVSELEKLL